jgi:hypothetical protein
VLLCGAARPLEIGYVSIRDALRPPDERSCCDQLACRRDYRTLRRFARHANALDHARSSYGLIFSSRSNLARKEPNSVPRPWSAAFKDAKTERIKTSVIARYAAPPGASKPLPFSIRPENARATPSKRLTCRESHYGEYATSSLTVTRARHARSRTTSPRTPACADKSRFLKAARR